MLEKKREEEKEKGMKVKKEDVDFLINKVKPKEEVNADEGREKKDSSDKGNFFDIFN